MTRNHTTSRALISLGGNQGNVAETFAKALKQLAESPDVQLIEVSQNYSTAPVGVKAGEQFINAAATLETSLAPEQLLDLLQQIEAESGRVRTIHWGPRTLDLDIILWGEEVINTNRLTVPHPACFYRQFVLQPAIEVAPTWIHPNFQQIFLELKERLRTTPLLIGINCDHFSSDILQTEFAATEEIQFVYSGFEKTAIVFSDQEKSPLPHEISLRGVDKPIEHIRQTLTAALDCPAVLNDRDSLA